MFVVGNLGHIGSQRTNQPVAQKNSKKCTHQRRSHFFSNFFRRAAESAHGDNDTEDGRDDAKSRERIRNRGERRDGQLRFIMVNVHPGRRNRQGRSGASSTHRWSGSSRGFLPPRSPRHGYFGSG
jgi:hypothetical protein